MWGTVNFNDYQRGTATTAIYPGAGDVNSVEGLSYVTLGLVGEAGEIANKVKKVLRDENGLIGDVVRAKLADELGDFLWYAAQLATQLGVELDSVAEGNLAKLADRAKRGVLQGSGDQR
jgi:NTP pyrophosphatase (non-canonical NTP hydrolase)